MLDLKGLQIKIPQLCCIQDLNMSLFLAKSVDLNYYYAAFCLGLQSL